MLLEHNNAFDKGERVVEVSFQQTNFSGNVAQHGDKFKYYSNLFILVFYIVYE
jgi:hypothetical protein